MWRELVVPFELARIDVQGHEGRRVEVVALSRLTGAREGSAGGVVDQIQVRIVGAGRPESTAAGLPRITWPRLIARFARSWGDIEAPDRLTRLSIERVQVRANWPVAAGRAD